MECRVKQAISPRMHACFAAPVSLAAPSLSLLRLRAPSSPVCLPPSSRRHRVRPRRAAFPRACAPGSPSPPNDDDEHDIPQSAVDWNGEWSKFQQDGMRSMAPKGREPVSKQQVAAARAQGRIRDITSAIPSRQQLFRDWRFWVATIAVLSLFSAFVQSSQTVGGSPI